MHQSVPFNWVPFATVAIILASFVITTRVVASYDSPPTMVRWGADLYECSYDPISLVSCTRQEYK